MQVGLVSGKLNVSTSWNSINSVATKREVRVK